LDNLLTYLRCYYSDVKTKCQLNFNVPAGFHKSSTLQKDFNLFALPCKAKPTGIQTSAETHSSDTNDSLSSLVSTLPASGTNISSNVHVPILRCVDKSSSSLPSRITFTEDYLCASVGFCRVDTIKGHLNTLYQDTILLDSSPADAVLDAGDLSTIHKSPCNSTPVP
jgi:hypothetical protein